MKVGTAYSHSGKTAIVAHTLPVELNDNDSGSEFDGHNVCVIISLTHYKGCNTL